MQMATLVFSNLPFLSALFCLGVAVFVLSRNLKNQINRNFALGMLALSIMEFGQFMAIHSNPGTSYLFWKKVSIGGQIFLSGPWLMFSLTFGRSNPSQEVLQWRYKIILVYLISLGFLLVLGTQWFLSDELKLRSAGIGFSIFLLLMLTVILVNLEKTFRSADHAQRWRIKFLLLGITSIFIFIIS